MGGWLWGEEGGGVIRYFGGYVMGIHEALVSGVPSRFSYEFGWEGRFMYGLKPVPFMDSCSVLLEWLSSEYGLLVFTSLGVRRKKRRG